MKKILLVCVAALGLAGCNTTVDPATLQAIQLAASIQCGLIPVEIDVVGMISPDSSDVAHQVGNIVTALCDSYLKSKQQLTARRGVARGVTVPVQFNVTLPDGRSATVKGVSVR